MKRKQNKNRKNKYRKNRNQAGFTLVELVVTFALLGILMVSASYIISAGLTVYYRVKATNYAQTVSDTIMDKVCGEIAGAQVGANDAYTLTIASGDIAENGPSAGAGNMIAFYNRYGNPVVISAHLSEDATDYIKADAVYLENGNDKNVRVGDLVIHYRPVNQGTSNEKKATNWTFDEASYMNYRITELHFEQYKDGDVGTNIMIVELKIRNEKNGFEYEQTRYVECYNFKDAADVNKITSAAILGDET